MTSKKTLQLLAIFILLSQFALWHGVGGFWQGTKSIRPDLEIVPVAPSKEMLKAFAFGDEEITFRYNAYMMQFLGDTFGRVTPLKDYDFARLYKWWSVLDEVNSLSDQVVYVVAYYYSSTQNKKRDIPYVVDYLEQHSDRNPSLKWWWYYQAFYGAKFELKDDKRAIAIADKLANLPKELDMPIWTRQLKAFVYEDKGEYNQACEVIINVIKDFGDSKINQGEMNYIFYFITDRLRALIKKEAAGSKIDVSPECKAIMEVQKANDLKAKAAGLYN
jgi:tetratricopeptide (TPR) repeat protein